VEAPVSALAAGPPPTLADQAYERLREEIIRVDLPPGTLLREDELMKRLGIGRTPVREALQRLQGDGFVTVLPRRGTLVSDISLTDLTAIYEVRKHLESWASRLAAERAGRAEHAEARQLVAALAALEPDDDYEPLLDIDRRIHRFVYRSTRNLFLANTADQYHNLSLRILHVAMKRFPALTPQLDDVVHDQRAVLEAICAGDAATAESVAIAHIENFERAIRGVI
jgi:DNA-binding GntR family transcriptional regulator